MIMYNDRKKWGERIDWESSSPVAEFNRSIGERERVVRERQGERERGGGRERKKY